jgi:hypothetical protein
VSEDKDYENQQIISDRMVQAAINKPIDMSNPSGMCYWCDEETGNERRFCDTECRDLWVRDNERD